MSILQIFVHLNLDFAECIAFDCFFGCVVMTSPVSAATPFTRYGDTELDGYTLVSSSLGLILSWLIVFVSFRARSSELTLSCLETRSETLFYINDEIFDLYNISMYF